MAFDRLPRDCSEIDGKTVRRFMNVWEIPITRPCTGCQQPTVDETPEGKYVCVSCGHEHHFTF